MPDPLGLAVCNPPSLPFEQVYQTSGNSSEIKRASLSIVAKCQGLLIRSRSLGFRHFFEDSDVAGWGQVNLHPRQYVPNVCGDSAPSWLTLQEAILV